MNCQYKYNNSCFGNYKYKSKYKPKLSWDATLPIPGTLGLINMCMKVRMFRFKT